MTLALGVAAIALLPALIDSARRAYAFAFLAALALFLGLRALPNVIPGPRLIGIEWNSTGGLLATLGMLLLAAALVRGAGFTWRDFALTWSQRPGSARATLMVACVALAANYFVMTLSSFRLNEVSAETWLYQATVPGIVEELTFRGVLLALADRIFAVRRDVCGAPIGWGGALVTLLFVLLHASVNTTAFGLALGVLPAAVVYLWLRARSGSLLLPIVVHNLWNLSVYAAHL
jgi:membrane protease YdiL (CAAX protease family)